MLDGTLQEINVRRRAEKKTASPMTDSTGGWLGITDKYWLAALVPDQTIADRRRSFRYTASERRSTTTRSTIRGAA